MIAPELPPQEQRGGRGPATFDFLGFTFYWVRSKKGRANDFTGLTSGTLLHGIDITELGTRASEFDCPGSTRAVLGGRLNTALHRTSASLPLARTKATREQCSRCRTPPWARSFSTACTWAPCRACPRC